MRIWKPKSKGKKYRKWYIELRDHLDIIRRFAAFRDESTSRALGMQIERLVGCKVAGEKPDASLTRWLEGVPDRLKDKLTAMGLLDNARAAAGRPLIDILNEFIVSLSAGERTPKYISETKSMLSRILDDCRFRYYSDVNATRLESYLKMLREDNLSYRRSNAYLGSMKHFCRWMIDRGYTDSTPLACLKGLNVKLDARHRRRAATLNELEILLGAIKENKEMHFGMTGYERCLLYKFAAYTGLRANEMRTLTVGSFDFENLAVVVEAGYSKHRREDILPLRPDLAEELKAYFANRMPDVLAFGGTFKRLTLKTSAMLRADLEAVGIEYVVDGLYFDFHSLRHTMGTLLAKAGVHPKLAQAAMRHSDIKLTMNLYTHTTTGEIAAAVNAMPDIERKEVKGQKYGA